MTKKSVAVLMGGWSSEREVSLSSGEGIVATLKNLGYTVHPIDVTNDYESLLKTLTAAKPDVVFNALHGTGGEDGVIQGFLDVLQLPYTHSNVASSAIAMHKIHSRKIFEYEGIKTPPWKVVDRHTLRTNPPFEVPFVVKPVSEGSSRGVYIVTKEIPEEVFADDWAFGDNVLVEKFLPGQDIQVAVMGERALGAIEIRPRTEFYDYKAKYTDGFAEHLMPAPLPKEEYDRVLAIALKAHKLLECRGVSRSDFMYSDGEFYLLELNTQPGMTPLSLLPEIAAHEGITFGEILEYLIDNAAYRA